MKRTYVRSSVIKSVGYDENHRRLEIEFNSGSIYEYREVEPTMSMSLLASPSKGRFFDDFIREKYPTIKVR